MAPARKRKSDEMAEPTTPEANNTPAPKKVRITQAQKQALIDNLQLEVTERARHLRAHYALQCADLRSRIERRINRIPTSMRVMTMEQLIEKHNPAPAPPPKPVTVPKTQATLIASKPTRKRKSSIVIAADPIHEASNENDEAEEVTTIVKPAPLPKTKAGKRPGSKIGKGGVLSPRSHNSRTLPRSPIKTAAKTTTTAVDCQPASPSKQSFIARPTSPLKPASPLKSAAIATTSAITTSMHNILATAKSTATRGKSASSRAQAQAIRTVSQASNHSATSNASAASTGTVVKSVGTATRSVRGKTAPKKTAADKPAPVTKSKAGTVKKSAAAAASTVKKVVTTAAAASAEPAAGRRILRKRN